MQELRKQGGTSTKKTYLLKPKSFKKLLLDIHDHEQRIKFRDYYILLEECISYYDDYQIKLINKHIIYLESLNNDKKCKIDILIEENKELKKDIKEQTKQINDLMIYAKDSNDTIKENKIIIKENNTIIKENNTLIKELITIVIELFKANYRKLYSINDNMKQTKILIGFIYHKPNFDKQNEYKYQYTMKYCSFALFTIQFNKMKDDYKNDGYNLKNCVIFGIIPDNMLTVQKICNTFENINKLTKSIGKDKEDKINEIIDATSDLIINKKHELFKTLIKDNKNITNVNLAFKEMVKKEEKLESEISDLIAEYLKPKILNNKNFKCAKLCEQLTKKLNE